MNARLKLADGSFFEQDGKIDFLDVIVDPRTDGQIVRATFKTMDVCLRTARPSE